MVGHITGKYILFIYLYNNVLFWHEQWLRKKESQYLTVDNYKTTATTIFFLWK